MDTEEQDRERNVTRNRSCSPLSQDFKSQDSGFSDSERSDCSEDYENATPKRKMKRKKMRRRRIQSSGIASSWMEGASPPIPTHTSTPKNSKITAAMSRFGKSARDTSQRQG